MAIPAFLDTDFRYLSTPALADVATIITDFRSEVVSNGNWTDLGGNRFKSKVGPGGRFMEALFTRIAANNLQLQVFDKFGSSIQIRRMQIDGGGNEIRYFTGDYHFLIDSIRIPPPEENLCGFLIEPSPDDPALGLNVSAVMDGYRNALDAVRAFPEWVYLYRFTASHAGVNDDRPNVLYRASEGLPVNSKLDDVLGNHMFFPCEIWSAYEVPGPSLAGRLYQCLIGETAATGTEFTVPIDVATSATFKATSRGPNNTFEYESRMYLRKA